MTRREYLVSFGIALATCGVTLGAPRAAHANGAFPDEFSVHFPPDAPQRILVGANFGLLISEDAGATWRYTCEPWVVAGSNAAVNPEASVSFYQVAADSALLASAVNITRSTDGACTWPTATGLEGQIITDIFASPTDPTLVLAIIAVLNGSQIAASHDGGKSFGATRLYETADLLTGVEIARSDPMVIYATSVHTSGSSATLLRSADRGATWTPHPIPADPGTQPRILGVDAADKNIVYLRLLQGLNDAIGITTDGGQTFTTALNTDGQLTSFLRATDGTLYAGTAAGQLYVRPPGEPNFAAPRPAPHLRCLGQRAGESKRFYACGDFVLDGYSLFASDDSGRTFMPVMKFPDIKGPLGCGPVATNCAAHWQRIQGVLGLLPSTDAGQGGGGGAGGSGPAPKGSCASAGAGATPLLLLVALLFLRRCAAR